MRSEARSRARAEGIARMLDAVSPKNDKGTIGDTNGVTAAMIRAMPRAERRQAIGHAHARLDFSVVGGMTAWLLSGQAGRERSRAGEMNAEQTSDGKWRACLLLVGPHRNRSADDR